MLRVVTSLLPFVILFVGLILLGLVLGWADDIEIFSFAVPEIHHDETAPLQDKFGFKGQEVGFAYALNWTTSLILFPLMFALVVAAMSVGHDTLLRLYRARMIVDRGLRPVRAETIRRIWNHM